MDFIYFNFDLSIVSLFIGILNDKKKKKKELHVVFSLIFFISLIIKFQHWILCFVLVLMS